MTKIVAIGGGEVSAKSTLEIDKEIIAFSGKKNPKILFSSDIIYVGGGNTLKMMTIWRKLGVDVLLKQALEKNIVLCGLSAGSICWFNNGNSDSRKFISNSDKLIKVTGLGFINATHCPHYDSEPNRHKDLKRIMQTIYQNFN